MKKIFVLAAFVFSLSSFLPISVYAEPEETVVEGVANERTNERDNTASGDERDNSDENKRSEEENQSDDRSAEETRSDERTRRTADTQEESDAVNSDESTGISEIFTISNIIIYSAFGVLLIILIVILAMILSINNKINILYDDTDNKVKKVYSALSALRSDNSNKIDELNKIVKNNNDIVRSIDRNVKNNMTAYSNQLSKINRRTENTESTVKSSALDIKKTTLMLYNDYLAGKTDTVPEGFKKIKISISGLKPMINNTGGYEFYYEEDGKSVKIYPTKENLNSDMVTFLGSNVMDFKASNDGVKRVKSPTEAKISTADGTIRVRSKGLAEY